MIVVVGAGPAGLAAARSVLECGLQVTVVDDNPGAGGQIWRGEAIEVPGAAWLLGTRVLSVDPNAHTLLLESARGAATLRYDKLILATGSRELFLPFPGWTLPGVVGAGGLQALVKAGLTVAGKRIVVGGTGPLLLAVAALLRRKGAEVVLIAEQARATSLAGFAAALLRNRGKLRQGAELGWALAGVPWVRGCWVEAAEGNGRVQRVRLRRGKARWVEECDYAAIGYGVTPNDELHALAGESPDIIVAPTGDVELATLEGAAAGYQAAGRAERAPDLAPARHFQMAMTDAFALNPELKRLAAPETLVCRCEDVNFGSLRGWPSFRAAKLHTRCGMGPCQGRICGAAGRVLFGWQDTSVRPPAFPARIGSLATNGETS
jgi:NADPH-dependent 2,4-dienoyl-CoA reductase/sulfur reductase-like enzyme